MLKFSIHFFRPPMSKEKQETASISTFKKWPFEKDFIIECDNGKVTSALCKYCSEVSYDELMREAKYRGLKGSVLNHIHGGVHDLRTRVQAKVIHVHEIGCVHDVYANLYWHTRKKVHPNFQFFKPCIG